MLFVSLNSSQKTRGNVGILFGGYTFTLSILLTIISLFIQDVNGLLLARYASWLFTFPLRVLAQFNNLKHKTKKTVISAFLKAQTAYFSMFIFTIFQHIWPSLLFQVTIWMMVAVCSYYLNLIPNSFDIHLTNLVYGAVYVSSEIKFINETMLYMSFTVLDVMWKVYFVHCYRTLQVNILPSDPAAKEMALYLAPSLANARQQGFFNDKKLSEFFETIGFDKNDDQKGEYSALKELLLMDKCEQEHNSLANTTYHRFTCVMFIDLVGFTGIVMNTELNYLVMQLQAFYTIMDLTIQKFNIEKIEIIGDCFLVMGDIVNILQCSNAIILEYGDRIRIGIDAGEVMECVLGLTKVRRGIVGHTVNMAARLESTGIPGKVHVSCNVVDWFSKENLGDLSVSFQRRDSMINLKGIGEQQTYFWIGNLEAKDFPLK